jgi:signal transduction histidine kinase
MFFFNRLARDIRALEARAADVVSGYNGAPLDITRRDEVGGLMQAVNRMQREIRHREQQMDMSRQQRFHHEKMAAIGSLAAAVAHEINNPIAAITGIARCMSDAKITCPGAELIGCSPELILEHAQRIASITRQVAELTAPHSPEPELLDLNALVTNTCNFISYDQRFGGINLVFALDHDLPAINAVADHLTQVLMNLLINAADALDGVTGRKPTIRVVTGTVDGEVLMKVSDNGCGMDRAVLSQAFNDSFTTKPPGKGSGLGLFLCKTLVEQRGGRIELESTPGVGTTAQICLPLQHQHQIAV